MQEENMTLQVIAHLHGDFPTKFGLPRQSGLAENIRSEIVFEKEFQNAEALRGIDGYTHLWLIWGFSKARRDVWSPTVRPPRLGGNVRMGVFATRSPFRPNGLGLSSVRLLEVKKTEKDGPVLLVSGADLMDGTPIYDVKPYIPYADSHPDARGGFADAHAGDRLQVTFPKELLQQIPEEKREALTEILSVDPRPAYQDDPKRVYGFYFAGFDVKFTVNQKDLTVCQVVKM